MQPYYTHADVSIYNGDCAEVLPQLGVKPDLILTSPPYDNLRDYGGHGFDFETVADAIVSVMPEGGVLVWIVADATIDGSETGTSFRQALGFMERGLKLHDTMIYESARLGNPTSNRYHQSWDYMFVLANDIPQVFNPIEDKANITVGRVHHVDFSTGRNANGKSQKIANSGRVVPSKSKRTNIWRYVTNPNVTAPDYPHNQIPNHPAIFPLALARDHIRTWTNPGDVVLDPMSGSGTTLRAAKDLNRQAIGIEIHEPYCDLMVRRLSQEVMPIADVI